MDPISVAIELELATLVLAGIGAVATWYHQKRSAMEHRQREIHHNEMKAMHRERLLLHRIELREQEQ